MQINRKLFTAAAALLFAIGAVCSGCGGAVTETPVATAPATAKAVITLRTEGGQTAALISGLGITVELPEGVTVMRDASGAVGAGIVTAYGGAAGQATVLALYTDASTSSAAKLHIVVSSTGNGFPVGEFATVTCTVQPPSHPVPADFVLSELYPVAADGTVIPDLAAAAVVDLP